MLALRCVSHYFKTLFMIMVRATISSRILVDVSSVCSLIASTHQEVLVFLEPFWMLPCHPRLARGGEQKLGECGDWWGELHVYFCGCWEWCHQDKHRSPLLSYQDILMTVLRTIHLFQVYSNTGQRAASLCKSGSYWQSW